ncbi:MAG: hypothetical protein MUC82_02995 [Cypionkella sp.]|jgi:hypothetical protein|nr:hypothetical protein [Cypionkella sp.]
MTVMDKIGTTILFSEMRPGAAWEDRFNTWYHEDHIPVRMVLDGWQGVQRYKARGDDDYLVVYDLASPAALKTPEYDVVKTRPSAETNWMLQNVTNFTRFIGAELGRHGDVEAAIGAPVIFAALFNVPEADCEEFDAWMTQDHVPLLLQCPQWLAVRRFKLPVAEPVPYTRLSLHYLSSDAALTSPERDRARSTEWRKRMTRHDWFNTGRARAFDAFGSRYHAVR